MARTYSNTPVMSKIKLPGGSTYYLKDADARSILDAISADVYESLKLALGTVDAGGNNLVTAANIKDYVDRIAEIGFDVVVLNELPTADAESYEEYHNNIVLIADATSETGAYIEYVILRKGTTGSYTYEWEKIGTTQADLSDYLTDVSYDNATHTLKQTHGVGGTAETVHTFGDMADVDTASTSYQPAGNISSVTVINTLGTQASKAADTFTAGTLPSKEADTFSAGTLPTKAADTFDAGVLPSFTEGTFNQGALPSLTAQTTATFAKVGIVAQIDGEDAEMLVFTNATTDYAVTDRGSFDAGTLPSKAADTFTAGSLPTYTEGAFTQGTLPSFTEGAFDAGALPTFVEGTFTPNVLPTTKTVTPTFTGTTVTITVTPDVIEEE